MDYEEHKKHKEEQKMSPDIGFHINVEGFQISEDIFNEEYKQIRDAYFSVIKKLQEHHKTMIR